MNNEFRHRVSLLFDVVLVVTILVLVFHKDKPTPTPVHVTDQPPAERPIVTMHSNPPRYPDTASPQDQRKWLVDQLRARGVPNNVLARLVWADLDWKWNQRGGELSLKSHGDPDTMAAYKLENAMSLDTEMRAALGEEGFQQWDHENMLREANQGKIELTPTETDAAYTLWKKVQQRELELRQAKLKGEMAEADVAEAFDKSISEFNQQMKSLLGDARYAKSQQIDGDASAANLRQDLATADPSDSQFQTLLQTQQQWNEQRAALDKQFQDSQSSATYAEQLKALNAARDQEYRRVLGDKAFDTMQKSQDPGYTQMKRYETLWGLDDKSIDSVYGTLKYYQKSAEDYQAQARALETGGQTVDWAGIDKNLEQFAQQTEQSLQTYLGPDRYNRMVRNGAFQSTLPQISRPANTAQ
jgi:hypothetical protein